MRIGWNSILKIKKNVSLTFIIIATIMKTNKINWQAFSYTWAHKIAFLKVEKQLLGRISVRGIVHDMDKLLWWYPLGYLLGKDAKWVQNHHRNWARHHPHNSIVKKYDDYVEMIIDWECDRFTKPDKPLNAYQTLYKFYPELEDNILPILEKLKLAHQ